ncbi:four-helix bundle copper-binding protein [Sphingobium aromaticiconvertens]|uniref:four-helix bundle copper-binding protein n=1 Tax=Sphingobium aromaticiconvertens TaxID=365341 RepID=UPI00301B1116
MSIHAMIALHPDVGSDFNELLATAAQRAMCCTALCTSCADACVAENMDMRQCVRSCLDCADICTAAGRLAVRRTGQNIEALRLMLESCARVCELCAEECSRHDHGHCELCAEMCRECAKDCRAALTTVQ